MTFKVKHVNSVSVMSIMSASLELVPAYFGPECALIEITHRENLIAFTQMGFYLEHKTPNIHNL